MRRRGSVTLLFLVALIDEYASGMPVAGAAELMEALGLSVTEYALAVFAGPALLGVVLETPLLAFADRRPRLRTRFVAAGLVGVAAALVLEALAKSALLLMLGVALFFPTTGLACGLAEGMLVDAAPDRAEQTMARWSLLGFVGDIATPLVLWALSSCGVGFRGVLLGSALLIVVTALGLLGVDAENTAHEGNDERPGAAEEGAVDDEDAVEPLGVAAALRQALGQRTLMAWLLGSALCSLLDETLAALTVVLAAQRYDGAAAATALLTAFSLGGTLATIALERLLRTRAAMHVLLGACALCTAGLAAFLLAPSALYATVASVVVGAAAAPLYPLAKAQAYRALPGRPGTVNALASLFVAVDVLAPVGLGALADRGGVVLALSVLVLQPLGLALLGLRALRVRRAHAAR